MITIEHDHSYLVCRVSGKLTKSDYDGMIPEVENAMELRPGKLKMMILLEDFKGWDIGALWEDLKFDLAHWNDFSRIAVVGRSRMEEWGTRLTRPFIGAKVRFFDIGDRDRARAWLLEDRPAVRQPDQPQKVE